MSRYLVAFGLEWCWDVIVITDHLFITMIRCHYLHPYPRFYLRLNLPPPPPHPHHHHHQIFLTQQLHDIMITEIGSYIARECKRIPEIHMHATGCLSNLLDAEVGLWCVYVSSTSSNRFRPNTSYFLNLLLVPWKCPPTFFWPRLPAWRKLCHKLVSWPGFDSFIGMIILANGLTIGDLEIKKPLCQVWNQVPYINWWIIMFST